MNTTLLLMAQFEKAVIPLEEIAEQFFNLSPEKARRMAGMNQLPIPTFRLNGSQKAPICVHIDDLAKHIDQERMRAKEIWRSSQL